MRIAATAAFATIALASAAFAQGKGVERLYILECGQGHTGDMSRWTPGQNVNVPKDIVDNCYLIKHAQGYFLWDTGVADSTPTDTPNSADPKALTWRRPKTLAAQLTELGVKPDDIKYVAVSHTHPDHIGNVEEFPKTVLLVQKAEYEWPDANGKPRFNPTHPVTKLEGDYDVFGDGSLTIISTPGHTPGHQSLFVRLAHFGPLVLSGDLYHYPSERTLKDFLPFAGRGNDAQEATSKAKVEALLKEKRATLWIQHDIIADAKLKKSPAFYD